MGVYEFSLGDVVVDREREDPNKAQIVNLPNTPAEEWTVYYDEDDNEVTAADDNPEYDESAPVVVVAYLEDLQEEYADYEGEYGLKLEVLDEKGITHYAFPPGRLRRVEEDEEDDSVGMPEEMVTLAEELSENAEVRALAAEDPPKLEVEKLGETYKILPDGEVVGDGVLAPRIEAAADEYLDEETAIEA